jgi:hypothetical protein
MYVCNATFKGGRAYDHGQREPTADACSPETPGEGPGNVVRDHPGTARPRQLSPSEPLRRCWCAHDGPAGPARLCVAGLPATGHHGRPRPVRGSALGAGGVLHPAEWPTDVRAGALLHRPVPPGPHAACKSPRWPSWMGHAAAPAHARWPRHPQAMTRRAPPRPRKRPAWMVIGSHGVRSGTASRRRSPLLAWTGPGRSSHPWMKRSVSPCTR